MDFANVLDLILMYSDNVDNKWGQTTLLCEIRTNKYHSLWDTRSHWLTNEWLASVFVLLIGKWRINSNQVQNLSTWCACTVEKLFVFLIVWRRYMDVLENLIYVTPQFCHLLRVWSERRSIIDWAKQSISCNYYWSFRSSKSALSQFWRREWARIAISARERIAGRGTHSTEHAAATRVVLVPLRLWLRNVSQVDVEKFKHSEWKVCTI